MENNEQSESTAIESAPKERAIETTIEANDFTEEIINDFENFDLSDETVKSVLKLKYSQATPIQKVCIPYLLENDQDIIALAKTGTGKTAAFGIPLVEKIDADGGLQGLVLCPTRELALQVAQNIRSFGEGKKIKVAEILGGESYDKQIRAIKSKPQVIVSTPGRLIDLLEQKIVKLDGVKHLILDEADEMLSFGFQDALEEIWKLLSKNDSEFNTWLFSATMSTSIKKLTERYLNDPYEVKLNTKAEKINVQAYAAVIFEEDKEDALALLIKNDPEFYGIIFATTKKQVAELETRLRKLGLDVDSLHGDKAQADRTRTINRMKSRQTKVLVATDVAARGLDIQDLTHVINFEIPWDAETFTHRIGRTARAGKTGTVWTMVRPKESHKLRRFEQALGIEFKNLVIPTVEDVQVNQKVKWIQEINKVAFRETEFARFEKAIEKLADESLDEISLETKKWLVKTFQFFAKGQDLQMKQPRALELRKSDKTHDSRDYRSRDDGGGRRDDRGGSRGGFRGGSRGGSRGGFRSRDNGGERSDRTETPYRGERSEFRGEGRSESRSEDRGSRGAPRGSSRGFAPRDGGGRSEGGSRFAKRGFGGGNSSGGGRKQSSKDW